jgi:hypothetical protein
MSSESDASLTVRASATAPTMAAKLARASLRRVLADRPGTTCPRSPRNRLAASVNTARTHVESAQDHSDVFDRRMPVGWYLVIRRESQAKRNRHGLVERAFDYSLLRSSR